MERIKYFFAAATGHMARVFIVWALNLMGLHAI
jgi:hypothetical protein